MLTYIYRSSPGLGTGPGKAQAWWMWLGSHVSLHPHHAAAVPGTYYIKVVSPCRECFRGPWAVPSAVTPTGIMNPVISGEEASPCLGHPFPQTSLSAAALMPTCSSFPSLTQQINFNSKLTLFFCWLACQMREQGRFFHWRIREAPRLAGSAVTHRAAGCLLKGPDPEQSPHSLRGSAGFSLSPRCFIFILSQTSLANFIDKIHNLGLESLLLFSCERWGVLFFFFTLPISPHSLHPPEAGIQPVLCRGMELRTQPCTQRLAAPQLSHGEEKAPQKDLNLKQECDAGGSTDGAEIMHYRME